MPGEGTAHLLDIQDDMRLVVVVRVRFYGDLDDAALGRAAIIDRRNRHLRGDFAEAGYHFPRCQCWPLSCLQCYLLYPP